MTTATEDPQALGLGVFAMQDPGNVSSEEPAMSTRGTNTADLPRLSPPGNRLRITLQHGSNLPRSHQTPRLVRARTDRIVVHIGENTARLPQIVLDKLDN